MKLPRDLSGQELARLLQRFGYDVTRQTGSHIRLTRAGETAHHITVPSYGFGIAEMGIVSSFGHNGMRGSWRLNFSEGWSYEVARRHRTHIRKSI